MVPGGGSSSVAAARQRDEHLLNGRVEGDGRELRHPVTVADLVFARELADDAGQAAVADRDRLRIAGGPGGVDGVADVSGRARTAGPSRPGGHIGGEPVKREQPGPGSGKASARAVITAAGRNWEQIPFRRSGGSEGSRGRNRRPPS